MEALADPYRCLIEIRSGVEAGRGLRPVLREFLRRDQSPFAASLARWFVRFEQGQRNHGESLLKKNTYRQALVSILAAGLSGESVFERLIELENEMYQASLNEIEEKLRVLPIKMLVPLLLLQFPAFLLLLFGPILQQLQNSFS